MRFIPNGSAFYSQKLNDDLYAGIGMYGNYGLGIDFGNWVGDRLIKKKHHGGHKLKSFSGL